MLISMSTPAFTSELQRCYASPPPHARFRASVFSFTQPGLPTSFMRFLDLPRELRDMVYFYALRPPAAHEYIVEIPEDGKERIRQDEMPVSLSNAWDSDDWTGTEEMSRLLRVNRQVYEEAKEVLYTKFSFVIRPTTIQLHTHRLRKQLGGRAGQFVRHIGIPIVLSPSFRWRPTTNAEWNAGCPSLSALFPVLQSVEIEVLMQSFTWKGQSLAHDWIVHMILAWIQPLLSVRVALVPHPKTAWPDLICEANSRISDSGRYPDPASLLEFITKSALH
ncbi:hypothetical protein BJX65DRAFT_285420 [Aspergillus insuetus]